MPTVADVVALPVIRRGSPTVVAGRAGLSRSVRWAHSAEISDIARLLREGDLVLTTGIALPEQPAGLASYVVDLARAGACALVIELGRRWHDCPPEALVAACEQAGLPLVTLTRETRFASVTEAVGTLVVDAQLADLRFAEEVHQSFDALMLARAEPEVILTEVRRMSGLPVVLESTRHEILGYDLCSHDDLELLEDWQVRSRSVVSTERTLYQESLGWLVSTVRARGHDWGRLVLISPEFPSAQQRMLVESAASTLALERLAARDRESLERKTHNTLVHRLASGGPPEAALLTQCAALGVPLTDRNMVGLVIGAVDDHGLTRSSLTSPVLAQERSRDLAELASQSARALDIAALVAAMDDDVVVMLASFGTEVVVDRTMTELADRIHRAVKGASRSGAVSIAAGSTVTSPVQVSRSLAEARHVLKAIPRHVPDQRYHQLADVHLRGLVHQLADDERVTAFVQREIGALLAYDHAHGCDLLKAVSALVHHGGNKSATANWLHLSRPALYDRLDRAESILGIDLAEPESLSSLHVALMALEASS